MEFWSAQSRHAHIDEDAAEFHFARQAIQKMLGRRISRDLVASFSQTTFYRRSERSIVINDIHEPRQGCAPVDRRERKRTLSQRHARGLPIM
jgi:hypothetical protein